MEVLARASRDEHRGVRCLAAALSGQIGGRGNAGARLALARELAADPDAWVRIRAAQSLARLGLPAAAGALAELITSERDVRVRATMVKALGSFGQAEHLPFVTTFLSDPDARVRANAIEAISFCHGPDPVELLLPYLSDDVPRVRANAARVVSRFHWDRAWLVFREMAGDPDPLARASAAHALGERRDERAVPLLSELLEDPDASVRRNARDALIALGALARPAIGELLSDPDPQVREAACIIAGHAGNEDTYSRLLDLTTDDSGEVRAACEEALSALERRLLNRSADVRGKPGGGGPARGPAVAAADSRGMRRKGK
jgi:HEAT repeat protein